MTAKLTQSQIRSMSTNCILEKNLAILKNNEIPNLNEAIDTARPDGHLIRITS